MPPPRSFQTQRLAQPRSTDQSHSQVAHAAESKFLRASPQMLLNHQCTRMNTNKTKQSGILSYSCSLLSVRDQNLRFLPINHDSPPIANPAKIPDSRESRLPVAPRPLR